MSDAAVGPTSAGAERTPDNASGGPPSDVDLPAMQGLEGALPERDDADVSADADPDRASEAGSVRSSDIGDAPTSASDPMPDMAGTQKEDPPRR